MSIFKLVPLYLLWHYTVAFADIARLYFNLSWFAVNFFSVPVLLRTFFSPWRRLRESRKNNEAGFIGAFLINSITRIIGMFIRFGTILICLVSLILLVLAFAAVLLFWILAPVIIFAVLAKGIITVIIFLRPN